MVMPELMKTPVRRSIGRLHIDDVSMPDAALGNDVVCERLHLQAAAFEHRHLQAAFVIEMHV